MSDFKINSNGDIFTHDDMDKMLDIIKSSVEFEPIYNNKGLLKRALQRHEENISGVYSFNYIFKPIMPANYIKIEFKIDENSSDV